VADNNDVVFIDYQRLNEAVLINAGCYVLDLLLIVLFGVLLIRDKLVYAFVYYVHSLLSFAGFCLGSFTTI
jgi:hypothetical protein